MSDLYENVREDIHTWAKEAFSTHVIQVLVPGSPTSPRVYHCARARGGSNYWFGVMLAPTVISFWGDLGEFVLRHGEEDSLSWLRGCDEHPDYLVSKIRAGQGKVFYVDDAKSFLDNQLKLPLGERDIPSGLYSEEFCAELDSDFDEAEWHRAWHACGGYDPPRFSYPSSAALWLHEALRWFAKNVA